MKGKRTQTEARHAHYKKLHVRNALLSYVRPEFVAALTYYLEIRSENLSMSELAHRLNEAGHRTPRGKFFDPAAVAKLRQKLSEAKEKAIEAETAQLTPEQNAAAKSLIATLRAEAGPWQNSVRKTEIPRHTPRQTPRKTENPRRPNK
jgi:hypothetical protein